MADRSRTDVLPARERPVPPPFFRTDNSSRIGQQPAVVIRLPSDPKGQPPSRAAPRKQTSNPKQDVASPIFRPPPLVHSPLNDDALKWQRAIRLASQRTMRDLTPAITQHTLQRSNALGKIQQPQSKKGKAGYCRMRFGKWRNVWKNRYFVLHPEQLTISYTKSWDNTAQDKTQEKVISLQNAHVSVVERYRQYGHCWMIENENKRYYLCAFTREEQYDWVACIHALFEAPTSPASLTLKPPRSNTLERKTDLEKKWEAWEQEQKDFEKQRQWRQWMLEINEDDFNGREHRDVMVNQGSNLLSPKPTSPLFPMTPPTGTLHGNEVLFSKENVAQMAAALDCGQLVWLFVDPADPRKLLRFSIEGKKVTRGSMQSNFEAFYPPGTRDLAVFEKTSSQFRDAESLRHTKWVAPLLKKGTIFYALLCRHLRRPDDFAGRTSMATAFLWGTDSNDKASAQYSFQKLHDWLQQSAVVNPDACSTFDCSNGFCPPYERLYHTCFGLSRVTSTVSISPEATTTTTTSPISPVLRETLPRKERDPFFSQVSFIEHGKPQTEEQAATILRAALDQGLPVLFTLNKRREFEYLVESYPDSCDIRKTWDRWKHPFEQIRSTPVFGDIFRQAIPAWTLIEKLKFDQFINELKTRFKSFALLVLYRFMQQPPDLLKPPVFGDVIIRWTPGGDKKHQFIVAHSDRLRSWLEARSLLQAYTLELNAKEACELLAYEKVYHKLFLTAPSLGLSPEAAPAALVSPTSPRGPSEFADLSVKPSFNPLASPASSTVSSLSSPPGVSLVQAAKNNLKSKFTEFKKSPDNADMSGGESVDSSATEDSEDDRVSTDDLPLSKLGYRDDDEREWAEGLLAAVCAKQKESQQSSDAGEAMFEIISACVSELNELQQQARFMDLVENRVFDRWFTVHMDLWHPGVEDADEKASPRKDDLRRAQF